MDIRGINPDDEKEILATAAAHLSDGGKMDVLGPALSSLKRLKEQVPGVNEHAISGNVVYVDRFGTCIPTLVKPCLPIMLEFVSFQWSCQRKKHEKDL